MIAHVVLLKLRADLARADRTALAAALARAAREIPAVRAVRVGRRLTHGFAYEQTSSDAADFIAIIEFDDSAGLRAYLQHPAHEELARRFERSLSSALVFDFGFESFEELARFE